MPTTIGREPIEMSRATRLSISRIRRPKASRFRHDSFVTRAGDYELLDFVDTPKQRVVLTDLGRKYVTSTEEERRLILRRQVLALGTFAAIVRLLAQTPDLPRPGEAVRDVLAAHLPANDIPGLFETVVNWGRTAELFEYDAEADELALFSGRVEGPAGAFGADGAAEGPSERRVR